MKLHLLYTFWTGDDNQMLIDSIKHHKNSVDKISVFIQKTSNKGNHHLIDDILLEHDIKHDLNFEMHEFTPDLTLSTKENERVKHNMMIQHAKSEGSTHFIMAAADHFYSPEMILEGKKIINSEQYDLILTRMRTYYKQKNWILEPIESYYMPFIHKMYPLTSISSSVKYPVLVDPSVKVNTSTHIFVMDDSLLMDHYSMIRTDIEKKFRNAAASIRWNENQIQEFIEEYKNAKIGDKIKYFQNRTLISIDNKN